jgi:hypothetical protein
MIKGERAPMPLMDQTAQSYRLMLAKPIQKYFEPRANIDLNGLPPDAFALADHRIRADAIRIGSNTGEMQKFEGRRLAPCCAKSAKLIEPDA